jgi:hypothetical protein
MEEIIDLKKFELPDLKKSIPSKKILEDKSNYVNTLKFFFNEDEEKVKNLNFFNPDIFSLENKDIIKKTSYGLFNFQTTSNLKEKKIRKILKDNQSEKNKDESGNEIIQ